MTLSSCKYLPFYCRAVLWLLSGRVSAESLEASVGTDVTLSCQYDATYYGRLSVCWGRGAIPSRGCADELIKADGTAVTERLSERYLLLGNLGEGDVSLTVRQVRESDSGIYGCRVDIPGWFNDHKHQVTLTVVPALPHPLKVVEREVKERTITVRWFPGFDGGSPVTSYRVDLKDRFASWDGAATTAGISPALTQVTLIDLRPAKPYNIRVFAINRVGTSEASNVLTITTKEAAPGGPPLDVHVEALTSRDITITWKPPSADLHNGVLRSYGIRYRELDPVGRQFGNWDLRSVSATRDRVTLNHLKPATQYSIILQAKTNAGAGPLSAALLCSTLDEVSTTSTPETTGYATSTDGSEQEWTQSTGSFPPVPPDAPLLELLMVEDKTISLYWTAWFDGGSPITSYDLEYKAENASWDFTKTVADLSPNLTDTTIIEMHPSTYHIRMFARNSVGMSEPSNVLTVTIEDAGHTRDPRSTASTVAPTHDQAVSTQESQGRHVAAIVVTLLVLFIVVFAVTWQLRRMKVKRSSLEISWLTNGFRGYKETEPVSEL
ncbi:cell adhesion molecule DSCAM-like isoform X2 [Lampris incognitus]|uniref:cell adhesion molecule DSCAM-like isoform X2 n=1 Tax=Lampris incognitus TaxID=2546036 RepID=UPI0024B601A5|nr:cell adhesion molecule DSCAM-like isoform X2 [Lampris incognitus]